MPGETYLSLGVENVEDPARSRSASDGRGNVTWHRKLNTSILVLLTVGALLVCCYKVASQERNGVSHSGDTHLQRYESTSDTIQMSACEDDDDGLKAATGVSWYVCKYYARPQSHFRCSIPDQYGKNDTVPKLYCRKSCGGCDSGEELALAESE
eukprot:TRINITY_DN55247_c0_g1_i1.p1 TRINITY_DN55247_c0_g1~~TRINITY_DN55247_c0_g1_i1.p1  ORF type:complete len:173 (+),score=17.49 TRINITY_DN55247_c0_g1_i1:58-519(+)